jgi:molecular chaperone DnaK
VSDWALGIDFGTSYTAAAIAEDGIPRSVDAESNGRDRMPSSVFFTEDGEVLVGTAAQHQAKFAPERYEPTPKRAIGEGEVFLGDGLIPIEDLIGAVLRRVYAEACRQQGERAPKVVRLTYPADWAQPRRAVLIEAAARAGLPEPELVPEPVAAAVRIALQTTPANRHIAVYDFGGGTFDAAVLLRTANGFEVAGPPSGRDPLGGEDIDQRIIGHLGSLLAAEHPDEWAKLLDPGDAEWRGLSTELHGEVQRAKETLSDVKAAQLWIPGIKRDMQLTRDELNDLIETDVEATIDALEAALRDASVTASDLAGLYLVGGSSRIPLVADKLWRRLGVQPSVQDNPKAVVAIGAATWTTRPPAPPSEPAPVQSPPPVGAPAAATERFGVRLAGRDHHSAWPSGCTWAAEVLVDRPFGDPLTIRLRDDPAGGRDTAAVARAAHERRTERTPGFIDEGTSQTAVLGSAEGIERRFNMTVRGKPMAMFERYLVLHDRSLLIVCPENARATAETIALSTRPEPEHSLRARFELDAPTDWVRSEDLTLWHEGVGHTLSATRAVLPSGAAPGDWERSVLDRLHRLPGVRVVDSTATTLLGLVPGQIVTSVWKQGRTSMVTKLGVGVEGSLGLSLTIALPRQDQRLFAAIARCVSYMPR